MMKNLNHLRHQLARWHVQHNQVADQALLENLGRLPWILRLVVPLMAIAFLRAWFYPTHGVRSAELFFRLIAWMDLVTFIWLALLLWLMHLNQWSRRITPFSRSLPWVFTVHLCCWVR